MFLVCYAYAVGGIFACITLTRIPPEVLATSFLVILRSPYRLCLPVLCLCDPAGGMIACDFLTRIAPEVLGDLKSTGPIRLGEDPTPAPARA
jgi:hypothetical protein